jgi:hypothetical protein
VFGAGLRLNQVPPEQEEPGIKMSTKLMGLWKRETIRCISSSALYVGKHSSESLNGFVLTVITPGQPQNE